MNHNSHEQSSRIKEYLCTVLFQKAGVRQWRVIGEAQGFAGVGSEVFGDGALREFGFEARREQ